MPRRYWLMKSDPDTYGLPHLKKETNRTTCWDGVRNYKARNYLRDEIREGDGVLFYHSQADPPAVVATATVVRDGYPDPSQFDRRSQYHDPKATQQAPRWFAVDIKLDKELKRPVGLPEIRETRALSGMDLLKRGSRHSVQQVRAAEWKAILKLGGL
jgi:predicted RNA-binding protein with PUA-like domain